MSWSGGSVIVVVTSFKGAILLFFEKVLCLYFIYAYVFLKCIATCTFCRKALYALLTYLSFCSNR